jgi:hypothetical protein
MGNTNSDLICEPIWQAEPAAIWQAESAAIWQD